MKRLFCLFLCFSLCFSLFSFCAFANETDYKNKYPIVFVHGLNGWGGAEGINDFLPYWGATTGDLTEYLADIGFESYSASVGPVSSCWDRACELYAQLMGTTVDYGEYHSKINGHSRYGRTYDKPLIDKWDSDNKIHLIGHSFGGTTVRMMTYLLTYGDKNETDCTKDGSISGLFTGGKEGFIKSVTTICTPHNEATMYYFTKETKMWDFLFLTDALYTSALGRSLINGKFVDFHLEQFGLTNTPGKNDAKDYKTAVENFLNNTQDTCQYDLSPSGNKAVNGKLEISDNVYYFSYAFSTTKTTKLGLTMPILTTNPALMLVTFWIGHHRQFTDSFTGMVYDKSWQDNDGLCNTKSELYPFDEPHCDYSAANIKTGIWNVMPIQTGDHGTAIGLFANKNKTHDFYSELVNMINALD